VLLSSPGQIHCFPLTPCDDAREPNHDSVWLRWPPIPQAPHCEGFRLSGIRATSSSPRHAAFRRNGVGFDRDVILTCRSHRCYSRFDLGMAKLCRSGLIRAQKLRPVRMNHVIGRRCDPHLRFPGDVGRIRAKIRDRQKRRHVDPLSLALSSILLTTPLLPSSTPPGGR